MPKSPNKRTEAPKSAIESMVIDIDDVAEMKIPHKTKDEAAAAIKAIEDGQITFAGAYHDKRKNTFLAHLKEQMEG